MSGRGTADLVVVTGPHRSGTTFVGTVLAAAPRADLLGIEPLNPDWGLRSARQWYAPTGTVARDLRRLRRGLPARWSRAHHDRFGTAKSTVRGAQHNLRFAAAAATGRTLVVKDPFLSLSLRWAATELTRRPVLVTVRHPSAWTLSIRRMDWHPGTLLDELRTRSELCPVLTTTGLPERRWADVPLLEASAWAWTVLVAAIVDQTERLSPGQVLISPLERLREDPVAGAMQLLRHVGLDADDGTRDRILALTAGEEVFPSSGDQHVLQRDTRRSLDAWRERLTAEEQRTVWSICESVAQRWYQP